MTFSAILLCPGDRIVACCLRGAILGLTLTECLLVVTSSCTNVLLILRQGDRNNILHGLIAATGEHHRAVSLAQAGMIMFACFHAAGDMISVRFTCSIELFITP